MGKFILLIASFWSSSSLRYQVITLVWVPSSDSSFWALTGSGSSTYILALIFPRFLPLPVSRVLIYKCGFSDTSMARSVSVISSHFCQGVQRNLKHKGAQLDLFSVLLCTLHLWQWPSIHHSFSLETSASSTTLSIAPTQDSLAPVPSTLTFSCHIGPLNISTLTPSTGALLILHMNYLCRLLTGLHSCSSSKWPPLLPSNIN